MSTRNEQAKFAFFYMLSLVALIFTAIGFGMTIFQIINQYIADPLNQYKGVFNDGAIKFGISALIIASPIYYFASSRILKSLYQGKLEADSGVRKWLTYFILFISSIVMISWLIATLNNFLGGEITIKFILKALTAILVSAIIFAYYLYDIKRKELVNKKDNIIKIFFSLSLLMIAGALIGGFLTAESPSEARNRRIDEKIMEKFYQIESANYEYYYNHKKLAENIDQLIDESVYLKAEDFTDPISKKSFDYNKVSETEFELCAEFRTSTLDRNDGRYGYYDKSRLHDVGYQCIKFKNRIEEKGELVPLRF